MGSRPRTLEPFRVSGLCSGPSEHKRWLQAVCSSLKYTTSLLETVHIYILLFLGGVLSRSHHLRFCTQKFTHIFYFCMYSVIFFFNSILATDNYLNGLSINVEFFGSYGLTSNLKKAINGWLSPNNWYLDQLVNLLFNKTWVVPSCLLLPPPLQNPSTSLCDDDQAAAALADEKPLWGAPVLRLHADIWQHSHWFFNPELLQLSHTECFIVLKEFFLIVDLKTPAAVFFLNTLNKYKCDKLQPQFQKCWDIV